VWRLKEDLTETAVVNPKDADVCFVKSLQFGCVQSVVEGVVDEIDALGKAPQHMLLPAAFGREVLSWEKELV